MARPPTPPHVVSLIETLWAVRFKKNPKVTAVEIHSIAKNQTPRGQCPSERRVQQIIKAVRIKAGHIPDDPPLVPWGPDWPELPEDIACLFQLLRFYSLRSRIDGMEWTLDTRTARWALKLRGMFDTTWPDPDEMDLQVGDLDRWADAYATREMAGEILKQPPYLDDLNGVMEFRPWENESARLVYVKAVEVGAVPPWTEGADVDAVEAVMPGYRDYHMERGSNESMEPEENDDGR
jgi:hypothetical protein